MRRDFDMISRMLNSNNQAYYELSEQELALIAPTHYYPDLFDEPIYSSDEFRMYGFKVKRCPRLRSHDWTQCPFAHRGEKARRRDPRRYHYDAVACPDFRNNVCRRGDLCPYAHGVFEYWLHPTKYRTRACNAGGLCQRRVCFFAHSPHELRDDNKYHCFCDLGPEGGVPTVGAVPSAAAIPFLPVVRTAVGGGRGRRSGGGGGGSPDFLASLSGLTIREGEGNGSGIFRWGGWEPAETAAAAEAEGPDIEWITDIME